MKKLFFTAFIQVYLVSINTIFLATAMYVVVAVAGFLISYVWTGNVRRIAVSTQQQRVVYSLGACIGGLCGLASVHLFKTLIQ